MTDTRRSMTQDFVARYWNDDSDLPKHERLSRAFADSISQGFWSAGMHLPTETELVRSTPCSLGTVQRALRELAATGLIERRRGSGTVVVDLLGKLADPWHIRYVDPELDAAKYCALRTKIASRCQLDSAGPWSEVLRQDSKLVTKIDRIFVVDERLKIYSEFYAISSLFPELMELEETEMDGLNFKRLISYRYNMPIHKVHQSLRFVPTPPYVDESCGTPAGGMSPLLNVVAYPPNGEAIYYQDFFLPITGDTLDLGNAVRHL